MLSHLCPALCSPVDLSSPGSFAHEIFQARILERSAISFSRWSSQPKDPICSNPCLLCLLHWQADSLPLAPLSFLKFNQHWSLSWWLAFLSSWYLPVFYHVKFVTNTSSVVGNDWWSIISTQMTKAGVLLVLGGQSQKLYSSSTTRIVGHIFQMVITRFR